MFERAFPVAASAPHTVSFSDAAPMSAFHASVQGSGGPSSPEVYYLTNGGTIAELTPQQLDLGGPIAYGGVPAAQRQAGEVHLIRSTYLESESFRTVAEPADVVVDAPLAELTQVTVTSIGGAGPVRFRAQAPARPAAIAYVFAAEDQSNSTPRWWSVVSSAVLGAGALDYTQPDLSGVPGFQTAWLQSRNLAIWQLRAVESSRPLRDLVGTANLLPINPHETKPRLLIPGPNADGLAVQLAGKTSTLLP